MSYLECVLAGFAGFIVLIVMCLLVVHGFRAVSRQFHDPALVFKRKVVWITGASSGLGEALAYQFARSGARLILSSRRRDELERVKSRCVSLMQNGSASDVMILPLDLSKSDAFEQAVNAAQQAFGQIDVMIHNGGLILTHACLCPVLVLFSLFSSLQFVFNFFSFPCRSLDS